jgi:hypothetical protein
MHPRLTHDQHDPTPWAPPAAQYRAARTRAYKIWAEVTGVARIR